MNSENTPPETTFEDPKGSGFHLPHLRYLPPDDSKGLKIDFGVFLASVLCAVWLADSGIIDTLLERVPGGAYVASLIAGFFFTSFLTVPLSIAAITQIADTMNPFLLAAIAAFGAVCADSILFLFMREKVRIHAEHLTRLPRPLWIDSIIKHRFFHWLTPVIAGLFIASPLPDEVGVAMLGLSGVSMRFLLAIAYPMHFFGILIVALLGRGF